MRILYYIPHLTQESGGIRQYAIGMLKILAKDNHNEYFILHQVKDPLVLELLNQNKHLHLIQQKIGAEKKWEKTNTNIKKAMNLIRFIAYDKHISVPSYINRIVKRYDINIVHSPMQFAPYTNKAKIISTMHDVQSLHFPEYFSPKERMTRAIFYNDYLRRSDKIIVSFDHIKKDLIKYFQLTPSKIDVILINMSNLWFEKYSNQNPNKPHLLPFKKYLLYPANTWPHKNHIRLLEAIKYLKIHKGIKVCLVCTGHKNDYYLNNIEQKIIELDLNDQVLFTGILDEDNLYATYKNAHGVVVPTTYEAGSFPLIESLLMNIPVICSNVTSLPETIDNDNFVFDPFLIDNMSHKIYQLWTDSSFLANNRLNASIASKKLLNQNTLQKMLEIYNNLEQS